MGAPMTYVHENRQYIVVPIGGTEDLPEWVALALPRVSAAPGIGRSERWPRVRRR